MCRANRNRFLLSYSSQFDFSYDMKIFSFFGTLTNTFSLNKHNITLALSLSLSPSTFLPSPRFLWNRIREINGWTSDPLSYIMRSHFSRMNGATQRRRNGKKRLLFYTSWFTFCFPCCVFHDKSFRLICPPQRLGAVKHIITRERGGFISSFVQLILLLFQQQQCYYTSIVHK